MIARLAYKDVHSANPYTQDYTDKVSKHENELEKLVKNQPANRLKELKADPQAKIDQQTSQLQTAETELNKKLEQAKASGQDKNPLVQGQLTQAQDEIAEKKEQIRKLKKNSIALLNQATMSTHVVKLLGQKGTFHMRPTLLFFRTSVISSLLSSILLLPWLPL